MNISDYYLARTQVPSGGTTPGTTKGSGGESFADSMAELIALQKSGGAAASTVIEQEREMLLQRLKDSSGDFFRDLKLAAIRAAREKQEEEEEQEAIDALMQVIDNLTGKAQADRQYQSDWAGVKLGTLEDCDPRTSSSLQMLAYLATLGDKGTFQVGEDEEREAEVRKKIQQDAGSRTAAIFQRTERDEFYAGAAERTVPSDDEIAALARKYDPDHIFGKDYDAFLEELEKLGALSRNEAKHLGYGGAFTGGGTSGAGDPEPAGISYGWLNVQAPSQDIQRQLDKQVLWRVAPRIGGIDVGPEDETVSSYCDILARMRTVSSQKAVQETPSEDWIASLAQRYDPHHMEQEEFVEFMDTLAAKGALASEDAEAIRNAGRWKVTVTEWRLEDGNGRVIDSGTSWTPPGRMDQQDSSSALAGRWLLPCLYDGGEDDGDVLAWARLGCRGAYSEGYQTLVDILTRMENLRAEETAEI